MEGSAAMRMTLIETNEQRLEVLYNEESSRLVPQKFDYWKQEALTTYTVAETWINGQPLEHLRDLNFLKDRVKELQIAPTTGKELFLTLDGQTRISVQIHFKSEEGSCTTSPDLTIKGLKKQLQNGLEFDPKAVTVCKNDSIPLSENFTLAACGVRQGTDLYLLLGFLEQSELDGLESFTASFEFVDLDKCNASKTERAPWGEPWRKIKYGINFEGSCTNASCTSVQKKSKVLIPYGCDDFDLSVVLTELKCPVCEHKVESSRTCVFWNCFYQFSARDAKNNPISSPRAEVNEAIYFKPKGKVLKVWRFLEIHVEGRAWCHLL